MLEHSMEAIFGKRKIGKFGNELGKIAGQALRREVGIKSRGDDLQVMLARMLWTSSAVTRRMLLKEGPEYGGEVNSGNVPRDTSVNFKVCLRLATLSTKY